MSKGKGGDFATGRNPFQDRPRQIGPDIGKCPALPSAVGSVLKAECAIIISLTRDGGAVCLTILDGDNRHRTYCSSQAELDDAMQALMQMYA